MSSSVIVARTRIWRSTVLMARGGNFCGAAWQRPQFARNRCSPKARMVSASVACTAGVTAEVLSCWKIRRTP